MIGFVSGCFDWLTPGHIRLFKEARKHCDVLHMLMADDETVSHYKGITRPLLTYCERLELVRACRYIDHVHKLHKVDGSSNQLALIEEIIPNIYFEGADATDENIDEYLTRLGIGRMALSPKPLHVSQILERHFSQFDPHDAHSTLLEVAGL